MVLGSQPPPLPWETKQLRQMLRWRCLNRTLPTPRCQQLNIVGQATSQPNYRPRTPCTPSSPPTPDTPSLPNSTWHINNKETRHLT